MDSVIDSVDPIAHLVNLAIWRLGYPAVRQSDNRAIQRPAIRPSISSIGRATQALVTRSLASSVFFYKTCRFSFIAGEMLEHAGQNVVGELKVGFRSRLQQSDDS